MEAQSLKTATRRDRIIYWIFTSVFCILDSLIPALTFNSSMAKEGILHLGYPDYFRIELSIGKIIGGILLILPMVPPRYKEWAYAGFGISIISAFISNIVVDNNKSGSAYFAIVGMVILVISYVYYHKVYKPYKSELS